MASLAERLSQAVGRQNRGDLAGAQALYWQILLDDPQNFDALHLLGVSKCQQSQQAEGCWFIARALQQRPDDAGALFNLATALAELHRHDEAVAQFDRALAVRPDHAPSWCSRGDALQVAGRYADAIASYRRALAVRPDMPAALANLGLALLAAGQAEDAIAQFHRALALGADRAAALVGIGRAQQELGRVPAARDSFAAACAAAPDAAQPRWLHAAATLPDVAADAAEIAASRPAFAAALDALDAWYAADAAGARDRLELSWPFFLAYQADNNRALMQRFGMLRARLLAQWRQTQVLADAAANRHGPIRVGIVSAQLYSHSVWHAITRGWFAHLDPARIVLHAFHTGGKSDAETAFARDRAASFTLGSRPLAGWVRAIQAVQPEVLLYPALGMGNICANLAALRLAPVQLASWGHPETTGLPTIDGYLSADAFEPADAEAAYSEALIRLPRLGVAYAPQPVTPVPPDLPALGIDPSRPILLCPGTPFKYAPAQDAVLAALARRIGRAQLVFFHTRHNPALSQRLERRLAARFAAEGLRFADHVRFIPFQPPNAFNGLLRRADVCLDSIGFSGFNTAMQVLAQGTPLVGYEGAFMRGRFASGILRSMGLPELVAGNSGAFIEIAVRLAGDPAYRATLRRRIAAGVAALYDDPGAVRALQDSIERLALRARA